VEGEDKKTRKILNIINLYGSFTDRKIFWEDLKDQGVLIGDNTIMGGDFNLTLSSYEVWGNMLILITW
jgi:hypothetical protein